MIPKLDRWGEGRCVVRPIRARTSAPPSPRRTHRTAHQRRTRGAPESMNAHKRNALQLFADKTDRAPPAHQTPEKHAHHREATFRPQKHHHGDPR